ncbi:MAG: glycosyltransferase [Acidobacteria bacterium]|nr:glycosyltransferase [Acidobacteriota bacterium]
MRDVSVVIPAYNAEQFIGGAIESALAQTCPVREIIVVDDGSTDHTVNIARSFPRVTCYSQSQLGPSAARNLGVERAAGCWIGYLDADDLWMKDKLERQFAALENNPEAGLIYSGRIELHDDGIVRTIIAKDPAWTHARLTFENPLFPSNVLVKRSLALQHPWPTQFKSSEDWYYFYKLSRATRFACIPEPSIYYRMHAQSLTHRDYRAVLRYAREVSRAIQADFSGLEKLVMRGKVDARLLASAAIAARDQGSRECLRHICASLLSWPFPSVAPTRYRLFVKMVLERAGA